MQSSFRVPVVLCVALVLAWCGVADAQAPGNLPLTCNVRGDTVVISWDLQATDPALGLHGQLERDGEMIAEIAPGDVSYTDTNVPAGEHHYALVSVLADGTAIISECTVVVGDDNTAPVQCKADGNVVTVTWRVSPDILALGFAVSRDNEMVATLGPDARSYRDEAPPGRHTYTVSTNNRLGDPNVPPGGAPDFLIGSCTVVVDGEPGLPGPKDLQCAIAESFPIQVQLFWVNPVRYESILVTRNGQRIASLEGTETRFSETDPGPGRYIYSVSGLRDGEQSPAAECVVTIDGIPPANRLSLVPYPPATSPDDPNVAGERGATDAVLAVLNNSEPVQAWSFGVCSNSSLLEVDEATVEETTTAGLNDGAGPTFLAINVSEQGVAMGVVIDENDPADVLPPGGPYDLLRIRYRPGPDAERGERYTVSFCERLGDPPVAVVVVVEGFEQKPATFPGVVTFPSRPFIRADADNNGEVNMTDGIFVLEWLFRSGDQPPCLEAADANGSLEVNIADAVYTFQSLFTGGPPPPPPFPECGSTRLVLGCEKSVCEE